MLQLNTVGESSNAVQAAEAVAIQLLEAIKINEDVEKNEEGKNQGLSFFLARAHQAC